MAAAKDVVELKISELNSKNKELLEDLGSIMVNFRAAGILPSADRDVGLTYPGKSIQVYTQEILNNRGGVKALSSILSTLEK